MATLNPELFSDPNLLHRVKERLDELQVVLCDAEAHVGHAMRSTDGKWAIHDAVTKIDHVLDELEDVRNVLVPLDEPAKRPTLEEGRAALARAGVILDVLK